MNKPKIILQKNQKIRLFFRVPKEEVLVTMKIRIDLSDTKPMKTTHLVVRNNPSLNGFVTSVVELGILAQTTSSCKLASKQLNQKCVCQKHKIPCHLFMNW